MTDIETVTLKGHVTERDHTFGPESAPVTLLEYGNFECIHCGRAYPVIKEVQKLLGDSLRFVFRHFPTVRTHPHSLRAAEAAEAAAAQGKFWEMHDQLFTHQDALEDQDLSRYAKRIRLDVVKYESEMADHTFLNLIQADYQNSIFNEHVTGTPTFYINARRYTGAAEVESLIGALKQADTQDLIRLPKTPGGLRRLLGRLRQTTGRPH